jgi:hypothetical protein
MEQANPVEKMLAIVRSAKQIPQADFGQGSFTASPDRFNASCES